MNCGQSYAIRDTNIILKHLVLKINPQPHFGDKSFFFQFDRKGHRDSSLGVNGSSASTFFHVGVGSFSRGQNGATPQNLLSTDAV